MLSSFKPPPVQVSERASLDKRLQELQAQVAALTMVIASSNGSAVVSSSPVDIEGPGPAVAQRGLGFTGAETATATAATGEDPAHESTATRSEVTAPRKQPLTVTGSTPGLQGDLKLGNGTVLRFSKQSVPDPPSISFAKDIPRLTRMWDDSSAEWNPVEAVLHIQGQPIALKYWQDVYRYGKAGQWAGTKKNWANWRVSFYPHFLL